MKRVSFMFAGQGAQTPGMGRDLYDGSAAARDVFQQADQILGRSISGLCFDGTAEELTACANCQPAIFTMSMACLAAFRERCPSVTPVFCGGLSLGELSACAASGALSFEDGLRLVSQRGELMDQACRRTEGAMAAVLGGTPEQIETVCSEHLVDVANLNCPGQIVISGEKNSLAAAMDSLSALGLRVVALSVAGAYHSRLMAEAADEFGHCLAVTKFHKPSVGLVQNVIGAACDDPAEIRENLRQQVCSSVHWEACARRMMQESEMLIEFGPGAVLAGFMKRIERGYACGSVNGLASLDMVCSRLAEEEN